MVKFSEVRKTSEASKYVCYWREFGGDKAASGVLGGSYLVHKDKSSIFCCDSCSGVCHIKLFYGSNCQGKLFFAKDESLFTTQILGALTAKRNVRKPEIIPKRLQCFETV